MYKIVVGYFSCRFYDFLNKKCRQMTFDRIKVYLKFEMEFNRVSLKRFLFSFGLRGSNGAQFVANNVSKLTMQTDVTINHWLRKESNHLPFFPPSQIKTNKLLTLTMRLWEFSIKRKNFCYQHNIPCIELFNKFKHPNYMFNLMRKIPSQSCSKKKVHYIDHIRAYNARHNKRCCFRRNE